MQRNRIFILISILFTLVAVAAYVAGLFIDVTRDAGLYATISREVFENGNLINLTIHGEPYDQKPPLTFWLGALGYTIGSVSNFWFKLPLLLLNFAGIYWVFRLGESLYNRKTGVLAAIILGSSVIYSLYSMDIHTDTPLQAFVTLALWQLFEFIKTGRNKYWITGFIAIGLAMLSKGPVGAAIPAFAVVGHLLLKKDFSRLLDYRWYLGIVIAMVVTSPALIGLMNQFGWEGLRFFFWENMVGRITGSYVQAVNDPIFYVHNLLYQLFPWSILFFMAAFMEFRFLIKNKFNSAEYFTLTGIWIYYIILNSASSQLPNYVFPIVPLMAVLLAKWLIIVAEKDNKSFRFFYNVQNSIIVLAYIAILMLAAYLFPTPHIWFWLILAAGLTSTWYLYTSGQNNLIKLAGPSAVVSVVLLFLLNTHIFPYMFSFQVTSEAAKYVNEYAGPGDVLFDYKHGQYELFFYSQVDARQLYEPEEAMEAAGKKGHWIFTNSDGLADLRMFSAVPDTIIEYRHLDLSRAAGFVNPATREESLQNMYLIKY